MLEILKKLISITDYTELDDRIEFNFSASTIKKAFGSEFKELQFLTLRWNGELQDNWDEFEKIPPDGNCNARIAKQEIIGSLVTCSLPSNTEQYFCVTEDFYFDWLNRNLEKVFEPQGYFNSVNPKVIWVGFENISIIGPKLAIINIQNQPEKVFDGSRQYGLPSSQDIKKQVHFVGQAHTVCEPSNYKLPLTDVSRVTQPIHNAYEKLLAVCLAKEFFGSNNIVISGIKRHNVELVDNNHDCKADQVVVLEKVVRWVYEERTQVRLLLIMDRISLDLDDSCCFVPEIYKFLSNALEQAKDKYEFVIKDRKEAHAKEISEFQKDIKSATDSYSKATNDLVSGLFKDALSAIFFLAIMLFSRLIGKADLLDSNNVHWLFKILAAYLLVSPLIRVYFEQRSLTLSLNDLGHWKETTRNHISHKEVGELINSRTKPYKCLYRQAIALIIASSIALAIFSWNIPKIINTDSSPESIETQNQELEQKADGANHQAKEKKST